MVPEITTTNNHDDNNTTAAKFDDRDNPDNNDGDHHHEDIEKPSVSRSMITHQETVGSTSVGSYYGSDGESSSSEPNGREHEDITEHSTPAELIQDEYRALMTTLDPPMSKMELFRDRVLRTLDHPYLQAMGLFVIFMIILDGALFFFMLMGWQRMCDTPSKRDCEPRNWWYNLSIQILNIFITYMNLFSFPWRCTNFIHITGWTCGCSPKRNNSVGCGLYGVPNDPDIWFHIPLRKRLGITCILLCNNLMQFVNHSMRLTYRDYEAQNTWPGNLLTSCFFLTSFTCAGIGGTWMLCEMNKIRKAAPGKFDPSPFEVMKQKFSEFSSSMKHSKTSGSIKANNSFNFNLSEEQYDHPQKPSSGYMEEGGVPRRSSKDFNNQSFASLREGVPMDEDEETARCADPNNIINGDNSQQPRTIQHAYSEDCYDHPRQRRRPHSFTSARSLGSGTYGSPPPSPTKRHSSSSRPRSQTMDDLPSGTNHSFFEDEGPRGGGGGAEGQDPLASSSSAAVVQHRFSMPNLPSHTNTHRVHIYQTHRYPDPTRDPLHRAVIGDDRDRAAFRMFAC